MHAVVVYESMFGNTQAVANAIADGLRSHLEVLTFEVGSAPDEIGGDVDLLVVGAPTHAFGLSRVATREDATRQTQTGVVSAGIGLREWFERVSIPSGMRAAAFDTRFRKPHWLTGSAARGAAKRFARMGLPAAAPAESFFVAATAGPLHDGEIERAHRWGERLAAVVAEESPARTS